MNVLATLASVELEPLCMRIAYELTPMDADDEPRDDDGDDDEIEDGSSSKAPADAGAAAR